MKKFIHIYSSYPLLSQSSIVFFGSMFANIGAWMYHIMVGRILGIVQYGELSALISLLNIIIVPASVLQTILIKFFSSIKATGTLGQARYLLLYITKRVLYFSLIGFVMVFPFMGLVTDYLKIQFSYYLILLYILFFTSILSTSNNSLLLGYQLFKAATIVMSIGVVLRLGLGILFAFWGVGWALFSNVLSNLITYICSYIPLRPLLTNIEAKPTISKNRAIGYSIPTFLTTLSITVLYSQDVLLVKHFFSPDQAGTYASLSVLGRVIFFATSSVGSVLFPVISERKELGGSHKRIVWVGLIIISFLCLSMTIIYFLFPGIVILLFGKSFENAKEYLGMFAIFISFYSLSAMLINVLLALEKMAVSGITVLAALSQFIIINKIHDSLNSVVNANILISATLFIILLVYYHYEK